MRPGPVSRRHLARRGPALWLGLVSILLQATLFGWHHHDLVFAGRLSTPIVANAAASPQAADDEDACEICQVLHHLTAAPVDFAPAPPPPLVAATSPIGGVVFVAANPVLAFRARAPPSLDAAIG